MAILKPFKAIRPRKELADKVAAFPYDVVNSKEAKIIAKDNPYSFLHVDKAEIDLEDGINIYNSKVYDKAKENLNYMINNNILIKDDKNYLYIYRLTMNGRAQTGIVGCTSIDDYDNNVIKKHEHTRKEKEEDRIRHIDVCNANTGPIFLAYKENKKISNIINEWVESNDPVYNFIKEDKIKHEVWVIDNDIIIEKLVKLFKNTESLYIADGHHRAASAVKVGKMRREKNPNYNGNEEFNFFLSVLFADTDLYIMDYNRVVKDLNGLSTEEYLSKVLEKFDLELYKNNGPYKPECEYTYGMYLEGKWYKLIAKKGTYNSNDVVLNLDVSILQNNLLSPILGIKDPRTDDRIDFIGGIRGLEELEYRANNDMRIAFSMYPTSIKELMDVADENKVMPPKSTWFEPKLRSGLFIHNLD
ncbi:hypothetical protein CLOACE_19840 [Clostridium acetireducens DSM 10703]|uniref:DUF1015 domain-containing protein n=1 Tax=Clostridium acetireducens DSM 10703 TaxID=1121290 RepID=A0A1E8EWJ5_9CLOT|nr:DUF1015 family protein [Clostridium acetireducens]OFI04970.1 hypothetical protein CLOACE_19840 [Clostridium acetireducens DSM 10703]